MFINTFQCRNSHSGRVLVSFYNVYHVLLIPLNLFEWRWNIRSWRGLVCRGGSCDIVIKQANIRCCSSLNGFSNNCGHCDKTLSKPISMNFHEVMEFHEIVHEISWTYHKTEVDEIFHEISWHIVWNSVKFHEMSWTFDAYLTDFFSWNKYSWNFIKICITSWNDFCQEQAIIRFCF
jgi:hypothetical protein